MRLLHDLFVEAAKLHPNKHAVIWDAESKVFSVTFAEIFAESGHISENLITAGTNSEYVGILVENPMIYPTLMIGVLRSYCAFVPIDLNAKPDWFSTLIRKLNIRFIFTDKINSVLKEWTLLKHFSVHSNNVFLMYDEKIQKSFGSESLMIAYAIQTSGSTGIPKIIRVPHQSIVPNVIQLRSIFLVTAEDTIFLSSPFTFDPSIIEIFVTLSSGASLLTAPHHIRAGPGPILFEYLFGKSRECCGKVSVLAVTPSYAACLFGSPGELSKSIDPALRVLSLGGEPCPPDNTLSKWRKKLGGKAKIFSLYGITEVSCWASVVEIQLDEGRERDKSSAQNKEGHNDKLSSDTDGMMMETVPLGSPLMETMLEVRDSQGNIVREGIGELFVGSETRVCLLDDEDASIVHKGGPIYRATGDIVRVCNPLKETGLSISYVQRKDEAMKRFGRWVLTKNIETLAAEFVWAYQDMKEKSIEASCCVSCGTNFIRRKIALFIVPSDKKLIHQSQAIRQKFVEDLMSHLHKLLPSNSWPDVILPIEELPLTEHAKLNKLKLNRMAEGFLTNKSSKLMQKSDDHLDYFRHLWMKYLNLSEDPSPTARFLSSGGDSLMALQLISELEVDCVIPPNLLTILLKGTYSEAYACINSHSIEIQHDNCKNAPIGKRIKADPPEKKFKFSEGTSRIQDVNEEMFLHFECRRGTVIKRSSMTQRKPTVITNRNSICLKIEWKYNLGKCVDASPVLLQNGSKSLVVVGSHSHLLFAIDALTGEIISSCQLPDRIESSACFSICGNFVFVGCYDHSLYSIKVSDGSKLWSFDSGNMIKSSPVLVNNGSAVSFGSYDEYLYCVNAQNGELVWKVKPGLGAIYSSPCLVLKNVLGIDQSNASTEDTLHSSGVILIGTLGGNCTAVSELDGRILWSHDIQAPVFTSPLNYNRRALFSSVKGKVKCFLIDSGEEVWSFQAGGNVFSSFSFLETEAMEFSIVFGCHNYCLYCLNGNGKLKWCTKLDSAIFSVPFIHPVQIIDSSVNEHGRGHWVSVTSTKGSVYLIEMAKGVIKASMKVENEIFSSPLVFENSVIFGCRDNYLYSIKIF